MRRVAVGIGWLFVGAMSLFCCANGLLFVFEVPFVLAFGWIRFLLTVLPQVRIDPAGVGFFVITVPLAAWLAHGCCRWLFDEETRRWRWKWTWLGFGGVLLMFVAGLAATGVVHQVGWLLRSPLALTESSWKTGKSYQMRCASNLKQISQAILLYQNEGGARPRTRADYGRMLAAVDLVPSVLVCPSSDLETGPSTRPGDWPEQVDDDAHFAYIVCATPILAPDGKRRVMLYEPLDYHRHGINVLYEDGDVEWLDRPTAVAWLNAIESSPPPTTRP